MARSISVKVPTATLVANIENKIAEIDQAIANYPAIRKQYEAEQEAYKAQVADYVINHLKQNLDRVGYDHDSVIRISGYGSRLELVFDKDSLVDFPSQPKEPAKPNETRWFGNTHATQKELLEKNLKILKMTSQEEVSASTYGAVMELL